MPSVTTRMRSVSVDIRAIIDGSLSPDAQRAERGRVARAALADAQRQNEGALGYVPDHETFVDGRTGAVEEDVKPNGVVVHQFSMALREDVIRWTIDHLWQHSPVLTGRFRQSITIYADGVEMSSAGVAAETGAEEILMVSTVAYARKIEKGLSAKGGLKMFEDAAAEARRRYGNLASVKFTFAAPYGGGTHLEQWAVGKALSRRRKGLGGAARQAARDLRNPAVLIRFR